jgi:hypothetical protein
VSFTAQGCWLLQVKALPPSSQPLRSVRSDSQLSSALHAATGADTAALPGQLQEGLQQSQ